MGKVKFKLNLKGLNELMSGPAMQAELDQRGAAVEAAAKANAKNPKAEYTRQIWVGNWICASNIQADNSEAIAENLDNNTLLKALNAGKK